MEHFFKSRPALWGWLLLAVGGPSAFAAEGGQEAEAASARLVDVNEYFVRGNTVLDARAIEEAVYPFLGPQKALSDIEGAREALQKVYQARGYQSVFVELPEQKSKTASSTCKSAKPRSAGYGWWGPSIIHPSKSVMTCRRSRKARCLISPRSRQNWRC